MSPVVTLSPRPSTMDADTANLYFLVSVSGFPSDIIFDTSKIMANTGPLGATVSYTVPVSQLANLSNAQPVQISINVPNMQDGKRYFAMINLYSANSITTYTSAPVSFLYTNFQPEQLNPPRLISSVSNGATSLKVNVSSFDVNNNHVNASKIIFTLSNTKAMLPEVTKTWLNYSDNSLNYPPVQQFIFDDIPEDTVYQVNAFFSNPDPNHMILDSILSNSIQAYPTDQPDKPTNISVSYTNQVARVTFTSSADADVLPMKGLVLNISGETQYYQFNSNSTFTKVTAFSGTSNVMLPLTEYSFDVSHVIIPNTVYTCTLTKENINSLGVESDPFRIFTPKDLNKVSYSYSPFSSGVVDSQYTALKNQFNFGDFPGAADFITDIGLTAFDLSFSEPSNAPVLTEETTLDYVVKPNSAVNINKGLVFAIYTYIKNDPFRPARYASDLGLYDINNAILAGQGYAFDQVGTSYMYTVIDRFRGFFNKDGTSSVNQNGPLTGPNRQYNGKPSSSGWVGSRTFDNATGKFVYGKPSISDSDKRNFYCAIPSTRPNSNATYNATLLTAINVYYAYEEFVSQSNYLASNLSKKNASGMGSYLLSNSTFSGTDVSCVYLWPPGLQVDTPITPELKNNGLLVSTMVTDVSVNTCISQYDPSLPEPLTIPLLARAGAGFIAFALNLPLPYYFGLSISEYNLVLTDTSVASSDPLRTQTFKITDYRDGWNNQRYLTKIVTSQLVEPPLDSYGFDASINILQTLGFDIRKFKRSTDGKDIKIIVSHNYTLSVSVPPALYTMDSTNTTYVPSVSSSVTGMIPYGPISTPDPPTLSVPLDASSNPQAKITFTWKPIPDASLNYSTLDSYKLTLFNKNDNYVASINVSPSAIYNGEYTYTFGNGDLVGDRRVNLIDGEIYKGQVQCIAGIGTDSNPSTRVSIVYSHYSPMVVNFNLGLSVSSDSSIYASWSAPSVLNNCLISHYSVVVLDTTTGTSYNFKTSAVTTDISIPVSLAGADPSTNDTLVPAHTYSVTVQAITVVHAGIDSDVSSPTTIYYYQPIDAPTNVELVVVENYFLQATWNQPVSNNGSTFSTYQITLSDDDGKGVYSVNLPTPIAESTSSYVLSGFTGVAGTRYTATVKAIASSGANSSLSSNSPLVTYYTQLNTPTNATMVLDGSILYADWQSPSGHAGIGRGFDTYVITLYENSNFKDAISVYKSSLSTPTTTGTDSRYQIPASYLTLGNSYSVSIVAKSSNPAFSLADSNPSTTTVSTLYALPIDTPTDVNLEVQVVSGNYIIHATWSPSANLNGSTFSTYEIAFYDASGDDISDYTITTTSTSYDLTHVAELLLGTTYNARVRAVASPGFSSAYSNASNSVVYYEQINTPTNVTMVEDGSSFNIEWQSPAGYTGVDVDYYEITLRDVTIDATYVISIAELSLYGFTATTPGTDTRYKIPASYLTFGNSYTVSIVAQSSAYPLANSIPTATTGAYLYTALLPDPYNVVLGLDLTDTNDAKLNATWDVPTNTSGSTFKHFSLTLYDIDIDVSLVVITTSTSKTFTLADGLTLGSHYTLYVKSIAETYYGYNSYNGVSNTVYYYEPISTVTSITLSSNNDGSLTADWSAPSLNGSTLDYYLVSVYDDNDTTTLVKDPVALTNSLNITGLTLGHNYRVTIQSIAINGANSLTSSLSGSALSYCTPSSPTNVSVSNHNLSLNNSELLVNYSVPTNDGKGSTDGNNVSYYTITLYDANNTTIGTFTTSELSYTITKTEPNLNTPLLHGMEYTASITATSTQNLTSTPNITNKAKYAVSLQIISASVGSVIHSQLNTFSVPLTVNFAANGSTLSSAFIAVVTDTCDLFQTFLNVTSTSSPHVFTIDETPARPYSNVLGGLVVISDNLGYISYYQFGSKVDSDNIVVPSLN